MKKKKVGIVTFVNAYNSGAFLQSFALQTYLEKCGYYVEHIGNNLVTFTPGLSEEKKSQANRFMTYREKYINFVKDDISSTYKRYKYCSSYDAVITGSDQVWNKNITKGIFKDDYFLATIPPFVKRISYAASIGEDSLYNESSAEILRCMLKSIDRISVREESAKKFLSSSLPYRKIDRHVDPTLLLNVEDYNILTSDVDIDINEKYIFLYQVGVTDEIIEYTKRISKKYNLKVIHNYKPGTFENEKFILCDVGEFLKYINNAELIITGSFHGMIFSMLYKKKFIPFVVTRGVRVIDLLKLFDIEHLLNPLELIDLDSYSIDYKKIYNILKNERDKSKKYLLNSIENREIIYDSYFDIKDKYSCYGCSVCKNVCPVNAIEMEEDFEGFIYPKIDKKKCIDCGLCKKRCIYKNDKLLNLSKDEKKSYVAYTSDKVKVNNSTSGGIVQILYDYVLKKGGYVVGVKYDENLIPFYEISNNTDVVKSFLGSKYVLPYDNDIYIKTKEMLEKGKVVLFVGSSCMVAGLKSYLNKSYDNLLTVDFVCHGYPSSKLFRFYLDDFEKQYNSRVSNVNFRDKSLGWDNPHIKINFENGNEIFHSLQEDYYYKMFGSNKLQKKSCYNCEFILDNKPSDLTVCDMWSIRNGLHTDMDNNNMGTSGIIINSVQGQEIFNKVKKQLVYKEILVNDIFLHNISSKVILTEDRFKIFDDLKRPPMVTLFSQYVKIKSPKISKVSKARAIYRILFPKEFRKKILDNLKIKK